ncbi:MAG: aminopeptidase P family protein [Anaerolineae bacterium]|nr:aminopeptidase P family protein [Anaerolineae bacterium]
MTSKAAAIVREKTEQAVEILKEKDVDLWITFVRETSQVKDPVMDLLMGFDLTWTSALLIHESGARSAVVGRYDVPNVVRLGAYNRVIGYDEAFQQPLIAEIEVLRPRQIAINYSESDPAADGLTYGMFRVLSRALAATPYSDCLVSAEAIIAALRGRKTASEIQLIKAAVERTEEGLAQLQQFIRPGVADTEVADFLHNFLMENGYGASWEWDYCPVVTVGPDSAVGHAMPAGLRIEAGHLVHVDFGISRDGFVSDLQRTWYVAPAGETTIPEAVLRAWDAATVALEAGRAVLKPGVRGWEVDAAARQALVDAGYPQYMHAFGHHIGRTAHDGATVLGPKWERYGSSVEGVIEEGNVFAIELGVAVPGRGYIGREENVVITANGAEYLSHPQERLWIV